MYSYHYDFQAKQWNVFDAQGFYVCSFATAQEASEFCNSSNGVNHVTGN
jgi:hypothetical protein